MLLETWLCSSSVEMAQEQHCSKRRGKGSGDFVRQQN
jgi:hypothetical protein